MAKQASTRWKLLPANGRFAGGSALVDAIDQRTG